MAPGAGYALSRARKIAIVGDPDSADTQALLNVVREGYRPFQVVALGSPDGLQLARERRLPSNAADGLGSIAAVPLLQDRSLVNGQAAAYVCRDLTCQAPFVEPEELLAQLRRR